MGTNDPTTTSNTDPTPGQTPPSDPLGQTPPSPPQGQTPPSGSQKTPIDSLPADIQEYIHSLRSEAEEARKKTEAEARAKKQAEAARLKEAGEFQKLAETYQARVTELEPIAERYTQLAALVAEQITAETKDWPAEIKTFDPGEEATVAQRMAWVKKSRSLLQKMTTQARTMLPGSGPNPPPARRPGQQENQELIQERLRATGRYGI